MTTIDNWDNADQFDALRDKVNEVIDLLNDETIDNIGRSLTEQVVNQLIDYSYGLDNIVILYGLELTGSNPGLRSWTDGAIFYEGNIYIVEADSDTTTGSEVLVFDDITPAGVHEIKYATLVNGTVAAGIGQDIEGANTTRYNRNYPKIDDSTVINVKTLEVNDWNMDSTSSKNVAHGLSDITKVFSVSVMIINDAADDVRPLDRPSAADPYAGGQFRLDATNVILERFTGGQFDDPDWNTSTGLRGRIKIEYGE